MRVSVSKSILIISALLLIGTSILSNDIEIYQYRIMTAINSVEDTSLHVKVSFDCRKKSDNDTIRFLFSSEAYNINIKCSQQGFEVIPKFDFTGRDSLRLILPKPARIIDGEIFYFEYDIKIVPVKKAPLVLDRGNRWYPLIADQIAPVLLTSRGPDGVAVLSMGDLIKKGKEDKYMPAANMVYEWNSDAPVFKIPLILYKKADYTVDSMDNSGTPIVLISKTKDEQFRQSILIESEHMFSFCNDNIGKYGYKKLYLFEVSDFEGININSGMLMVGTAYFEDMQKGYYDGIHLTIAQQWFGASAFAEFGKPGFWFLSLSLPHYIRLMHMKQTAGPEAYDKEMAQLLEKYNKFAGSENDVAVLDVDFPNTKEKGTILYTKGPYIFSKLNDMMGYEKFVELVAGLYSKFKHKLMTYDDFFVYLAAFDPDGTISRYLDKAVREKGLPG